MIKSILITFLFVSTVFSQTKIYTVDELILQAIKNSPDINISKLNLEASKQRKKQAFSGYLPKIDLNAKTSYVNFQDAPLINNTDDTTISGDITLNQLLYDFGKTSGLTKSYENEKKAFNEALREQIILKKRDVKLAYYNILKNLALINVNKENIKLNKAQLNRSKKYFEAGIRTKIDISDAEVRVVKAEITLKTSQYNLKNSYAILDRIVGFSDITTEYKVYKKSVNLENGIYNTLPSYDMNMSKAIIYAYKNRPELLKYMYTIKSNKELQKSYKSKYYPSFYFDSNYEKIFAKKYKNLLNKEQYTFGIYLNWNLYTGGFDKAKIQEQAILTSKSSSIYKQTQLKIKEEVTKAYIELNKIKENVLLSQNLLKLSKEKLIQITKQYKHGLSDYIELQVARQGYIDAKSNLIISYYNYYSAMAILDAAIGR
jgi:outer membrane protein